MDMEMEKTKSIRDFERLLVAFFQVNSMITAHEDLSVILERIVRETLHCLKTHRSSVFLLDGKNGILKTQFTYAFEPKHEQVSLLEEKEIAKKAIKQGTPLLLREPKNFEDFFKYRERERRITSLLSIPLSAQGKFVGALSSVLVNETRHFNERDLKNLSLYGSQASIAIENAQLREQVSKEISSRKTFEQYLDDILNRLENRQEDERHRIEEHIGKLLSGEALDEKDPSERQTEAGNREGSSLRFNGELDLQGQDEEEEDVLRVEFEDASLSLAEDLTSGGVFIRTPNPLELGEQFLLKLHLREGREPIKVSCKVIWTNKYGKESKYLRRGMGVKFLNLEDGSKKRIEEYAKSQRNNHVKNIG